MFLVMPCPGQDPLSHHSTPELALINSNLTLKYSSPASGQSFLKSGAPRFCSAHFSTYSSHTQRLIHACQTPRPLSTQYMRGQPPTWCCLAHPGPHHLPFPHLFKRKPFLRTQHLPHCFQASGQPCSGPDLFLLHRQNRNNYSYLELH